MNPKNFTKMMAEIDQVAAMVGDSLPTVLRGLHDGLVAKGFTDDQAFELTRTYLEITFAKR